MVMAQLIIWWYGEGWLDQLRRIRYGFIKLADRFSISLLLKTFFAPFRQISADDTGKTINAMFDAMLSKLISRMIGAIMRFNVIIIGVVSLVLLAVLDLIRLIGWLILPAIPLLGFILMITVGTPWK